MSLRTGSMTGTVRVLPPLPRIVTRSIAPMGARARSIDSASEMRNPTP